jgi:hypothetical protein
MTIFFAVVPAFLWHEVKTHEFERHGPFASILSVFVFFVFILPAFTAPFGTTILGWISVSQIRRSAGRLYGLGLAVFDGLLFPLLAVDVLLGFICAIGASLYGDLLPNGWKMAQPTASNYLCWAVFIVLTGLSAAAADLYIIRRVWRAVNQPLNGKPPTAAPTAAATLQKTAPRWRVAWIIGAVACGFVLLSFAVALMQQQTYRRARLKAVQNAAARSQVPTGSSISKSNRLAVLYHYKNESLHFALFHAGRSRSHKMQDTNTGADAWLNRGDITLANGRTFGYRRESWDPEHLNVNGREFDLRAGRVLVLRDDGTVEQLSLFPSLAAARDVDELSRLIVGFAEPPKLRFLAWQGESPLGNDWKAWRPDGTRAESTAERDVLQQLILHQLIPTRQDYARVMNLWFSHPGFDRRSQCSIHLTDPAGKVIPAFSGSTFGEVSGPRPLAENNGWFISGFAPASGVALPSMVNARLDYSLGKWTDGPRVEVRPKANASISMPHVVINTVGDTVDGKAFVSLVRDLTQTADTQYDFCAETKDGRVLDPTGGWKSGADSAKTERFEFEAPIREIKEFRLRTRKIQSVTYTNVVVQTQQPLATTQNPIFGPVMQPVLPDPPAALVRADIGKDIPLKRAIDEFNTKFPDVQPLTEAEVIAAVRSIKESYPDLPDSVFRVFQRVTDEHLLPKGMYFTHTAKFRAESREFEVDWKDLALDLGLAGVGGSRSPGTVFNIRIRTRFISVAGAGISPAAPLTQSSNKLDVTQVNIQDANHEDIPLALAIAAANAQRPDLLPPLTEAEVIAAVSAIKSYIPNLPDSVHAVYERIVKERVFPKGMRFGHIGILLRGGRATCRVDWNDLILDCDRVGIRGFKPGTEFVHRIRARYISAW